MEKVIRIQRGQKTYPFGRLSHIFGLAEEKSFSIIYIDHRGRETSLDLICPSKEGHSSEFMFVNSF
jgi:hypothetical protein